MAVEPQAALISSPKEAGITHLDDSLYQLVQRTRGGVEPAVVSDSVDLLTFDGDGRVGVTVTAANVGRTQRALVPLGFRVIAAMPDRHLVEGYLPTSSLMAAEGLGDRGLLLGVLPIYAPETSAGLVTSQADNVVEADRVRATLPEAFDGTGVTIGVLSDSYNALGGASSGVASGDLPAGVNVLQDSSGDDEGRAMIELIHDLAPGSSSAFATANGGEANFANNIRRLANPAEGNARVIVDDIVYLAEPFFQDGIVAQAVDEVANNRGVSYFTSAGNRADQAYLSTDFAGSNATIGNGGLVRSGRFHDFDPGVGVDTRQRFNIGTGQSLSISLQWDDPFYTTDGVDTDLDIFLIRADTGAIVARAESFNIASQRPSEVLGFNNDTGQTAFDLAILNFSGPDPGRLRYVIFGSNSAGPIEFDTNSPTVNPHARAVGALATAAVPYFDQTEPESFTSLGGALPILFSPTGERLGTPEIRQKPDLAAPDGTNTTFFGGGDVEGDGFPNFFGTSAAAPHAAAVAALLRQAEPSLTPTQVADRLRSTATDVGEPGNDDLTGAGRVNAFDAIFGDGVPADLPLADGFESGALSRAWDIRSNGAGRILVTGDDGPANGTRHLTLDSALNNQFSLNEAILHIDAAAALGPVLLTFNEREFADEDDPMPASFTGSSNSDGVALSVDGVNWFRIVSLTGANSTGSNQAFSFDLSQIAADNGLTLGSDTRIKFQQFDNFGIPSDGIVFDDVAVTAAAAELATIDGAAVNPMLSVLPAQRSTVRSLAVDFQGVVASASTGAFTVTRLQDGQSFEAVAGTPIPLGDGRSRVILTFTGDGLESGSLPDGDYTLTVDGDLLTDAQGRSVDGDGDGVAGGTAEVLRFHRFFGDADGDRDVDASDFVLFRQSYVTPSSPFIPVFDFNNDGVLDTTDLNAFYQRRAKRLPPV